MHTKNSTGKWLCILLCGLGLTIWRAPAQSKEYQIKGAFLYNFAQFVEWPPAAFSSDQSPLVIGVLGENPFDGFLAALIQGEKVNNHPLVIQFYDRPEQIQDCHILFISRSEAGHMDQILAGLKGREILTVSDSNDFTTKGGIIQFTIESNKIRFLINLEAAKAADLIISSKLLKCAEPAPRGGMTMPLKNIPIQRKLMVIILLTTVAALVLMQSIFFVFEYFTFRNATLRQLSTAGEVIAANSTAALAFDNQDDAREILGALKAEPHVIAGALYDEDGGIFTKYPADLPTADLPRVPRAPGYYFQGLFLTDFQPVVQGNRQLGMLYLKLDTGPTMRAWLKNSAAIAVIVIAIALIVAYLISRILQKQISQPILSLAAVARKVSEHGDYSARATRLGNDELGLLTDSFNQMLAQIQNFNAMLERRVQERTAQLEAANKELEAFSYSVSHDLRAPLRHVDGFAEMLRNDASSGLSPTGQRHLQVISDSARRMGTLIDDLLVFSRMGRSEMRRTTVSNDTLVAEVLQEMASDLQGRNIKWEIAPLPEVNGDRAMLKQVWVNLLSNAVKYSRQRTEALIQVRCRKNESALWEFSVQDNGAGFNMEYANKLFGVFQRLHHADEFEGTGIGLANVRRIVLRHGGTTWAKGEIDKGATFYFTIPVTGDAKHEKNGSNSAGGRQPQ